MTYTCPNCQSTDCQVEGGLAYRIHLRCRDCGTWFSRINKAKKTAAYRKAERKAKEQYQRWQS